MRDGKNLESLEGIYQGLTRRSSRSHVSAWGRVVWLVRCRKVDSDASALELGTVKTVNAFLRVLNASHSDESKATRSFGLS
jgi:hypothetical protein